MAIDRDRLLALEIPEVRQDYGPDRAILYALGCGAGVDPLDPVDLPFVYEEEGGFALLPSFATVLGHPGFWARDLDSGIDWLRVMHGEQGLRLHRPLPAAGSVRGKSRVVEVIDKGEGRGALVYVERHLTDAEGGLLATLTQTLFCRGDGGFGGPAGPARRPAALPEASAERRCLLPTAPQAALIYRLSGDRNPLHADPAVARKAGFERPILHGLATFGLACRALLRSLCPGRPEALTAMDCRFSAPVYPGETVETEIWDLGESAYAFRARVGERVVLDNGRAELAAAKGA